MQQKVLEINVDDLGFGGVFSLIKNVIINKHDDMKIDIACIEKFENLDNIKLMNQFGSDVYYVGYEKNKLLKQFYCFNNLRKLIHNQKYNCVHIHADVANKLMISGLASKSCGVKKIILHSHASGVDGKNRKLKKLLHYLCRKTLKFIGTDYVSCSDIAAKWMFPNINKKSIVIVNNGVDLERFRYNSEIRNRIRDELNLDGSFVIGHVGRFAYQKNHEYLIDIFSATKIKIKNSKLLLIGEGILKQEIQTKVKKEGIGEDVIFYGTSNRVYELFQAMDVFVLPSYFEGLPIVGVEAQASGLPVLFSDKITNEAKLTNQVYYLNIDNMSINDWVDQLVRLTSVDRKDTYSELKERGFSIQDTIHCLLRLYK